MPSFAAFVSVALLARTGADRASGPSSKPMAAAATGALPEASVLFPATAKAQEEAFKALLAASEAVTPAARAAALANSVLSQAYTATGMSGRSTRSKQQEGDDVSVRSRELASYFDKMERNRLRQEALDRIDSAVALWDDRPDGPLESPQQLQDVKNAVASWVSAGEEREERGLVAGIH